MGRRLLLGLLGIILTLGLVATPGAARAAAPQIAISPGYGPPGTRFSIAVTGLPAEMAYTVAVYRLADGALVGEAGILSDKSGTFVATYDSTGDAPGRYGATVISRTRGNQIIGGEFTVAGASGADERHFPETGFTVSGRFLAYWEANGGLPINGYPISDVREEVLEDGKPRRVQYFERVRLEYHPENAPPYDVLLGQFGRRIHPADPPAAQIIGAMYFPETGHNLSDITADRRTVVNFGRYWDNNGGLRQFGYPITEIFAERLEDGNTYLVQYFERARFEYHPEYAGTPAEVLLGQFGRRILGGYPGEPAYQVGTYLSDDTPRQGTDVVVNVDVGRGYRPLASYRIETVWRFASGARGCQAAAAEPGQASCTLNIGNAPVGVAVPIDITIILPDGARLTAQISFTPRRA